MKPFLDENFLLHTSAAQKLYHQCAKDLPIIDYHCHVNTQDIAEDKVFSDMAEVWLGGDHYKWRLMRADGVPEEEITGSAPGEVKFRRFARALSKAAGNPIFHWSHLELKRYFGYDGILNENTASEVWKLCMDQLPQLSVRQMILRANVETICTTDDPADDLRWHRVIREDLSFPVKVLPTWRPDRAMSPEKMDYPAYLDRLSAASGVEISDLSTLTKALRQRMDCFEQLGCRISDHGLESVPAACMTRQDAEKVFQKALRAEELSPAELEGFRGWFLDWLAEEYAVRGWVMQLHYGALRSVNTAAFQRLGPDTGFDCIRGGENAPALALLLDRLERRGSLPKTILYSLNANDNSILDALAGSFCQEGIAGKVQHGAAWWFHDTKHGMREHLISLASSSLLGNFVGMLTDSRSFLSYTRHEYFRRIFCALLGDWVENGEYPEDWETLEQTVHGVCCENARRYFGF